MTSYYCSWVCKSAGQFFWSQMDSHMHLWAAAGQIGGCADPSEACMFGVCWLLLGVGWPQLFSMWLLTLQQANPCWRQGSKRECGSVQGFLRLRLRLYNFCHILLANTSYKVSPDPQRSCKVTLQKLCIQGRMGNSGIFCNLFPSLLKKLSISRGSYNNFTLLIYVPLYCPQI